MVSHERSFVWKINFQALEINGFQYAWVNDLSIYSVFWFSVKLHFRFALGLDATHLVWKQQLMLDVIFELASRNLANQSITIKFHLTTEIQTVNNERMNMAANVPEIHIHFAYSMC